MATDNRTQLNNCDQDTDAWAGDGGATDNTEAGNVYEGLVSQGCTLSNALEREVVSTIGGTRDLTDATVWAVVKDSLVAAQAAGGYQIVLDDGPNEIGFYVGGYDFLPMPLPFFFWALKFDVSEDDVFNTASRVNAYTGSYAAFTEAAVTGIGYGTIHAAKAKSENVYLDGFYFIANGSYALTIDAGTVGTPDTWALVVADDVTNGGGMISNLQGNKFDICASWEWGVALNQDSYFEDSDFQVFIDANDIGAGNFIVGATVGTGTNSLKLSNGLFQNLGTPSIWDLSDTDYNTLELDTVQWNEIGTMSLPSSGGTSRYSINCVFNGCDQVTNNGADMDGSSVLLSIVAADVGALLYNETANPNGILDNLTLEQGTADHHAIDFGVLVTADITLTGIEFTGFDETTGEDQPGAALRFLATSGSLICNLVGCTVGGVAASASNFFKDDAAGIAVTLVFDTIPLRVTVTDAISGSPITDARVYAHKDGDTATVYFEDETDTNGEVNDNIAYPGDTDVVGWARQLDSSGFDYVQKDFTTTITNTGFNVAIQLERVT